MALISAVSSINNQLIYSEYAKKDISARNIVDTYATKEELNQVTSGSYSAISAVSGTLSEQIASESERAAMAEADLHTQITEENIRALDAEALLNTYITDEKTRAETAEDNIISSIAGESARAIAEEQRIETKIDSEIERSTSKDETLASSLNEEITRSLQEDTNIRTALTDEITRATNKDTVLENKITQEIELSTTRYNELITAISAEAARASTREDEIEDALEAEITSREGDSQALTDAIESEATARVDADQTLQGNINIEIATRAAADTELLTAITAESTRATQAETSLGEVISNETTRATARENSIESTLTGLINAETTRATENEAALNTAIANEATVRQQADNDLQGQINAIEATQNVIDLVGTYAELEAYDTTHVKEHDKIQVIRDETFSDQTTIYSWENNAWERVGSFGPYYTQEQVNAQIADLEDRKQDNMSAGDGIDITENVISHSIKIIETDNYDTVEGTKLTVYLKNNKYKKISFNKTITDIEFIIEKTATNVLQETGFEFACPEDSELENVTFSVLNDDTIKILTIIPDSYTAPNVYQGTIVNYKCTIGEFEVED